MKKFVILAMGLMMTSSIALADDSMFIDSTGKIGMGTNTPENLLHIKAPSGSGPGMYKLEQTDPTKIRFILVNPNGAWSFDMDADANAFTISKIGEGAMLKVTNTGQLYIKGVLAFDANNP